MRRGYQSVTRGPRASLWAWLQGVGGCLHSSTFPLLLGALSVALPGGLGWVSSEGLVGCRPWGTGGLGSSEMR